MREDLTPPMAVIINNICLIKSMVDASNIPFSNVDMVSKVPPIAATIAQMRNRLAARINSEIGGSPVK